MEQSEQSALYPAITLHPLAVPETSQTAAHGVPNLKTQDRTLRCWDNPRSYHTLRSYLCVCTMYDANSTEIMCIYIFCIDSYSIKIIITKYSQRYIPLFC